MSISFPSALSKPSGITALPSGTKRPAFGTLYGFDSSGGDSGGGGSFTNTYSVDFDGSNDHMAVTGITLPTAKTVSFWINLNTTSTDDVIFGHRSGRYYPYMPNNQRVNISNASQVKILDLTASHALSANTWHHLVIVGDGTTAKLYKDGVYRATADDITPGGSLSKIGGASLNGSRYLAGKLDEFSVFESALSDGGGLSIGDTAGGDVAALYGSGSPPDIESLNPVHWWRMGDNDSGTGTTVTDQGSGSNDGTLTNGATFSTDVP